MTDDRKSLGRQGESAALGFLQVHGFKILETNFRTRAAEIDIIAKDHETLCFIEVKTRRSIKKGLPKESVTPLKQNKIILGASFYLKKMRLPESKIRFDVIEVLEKEGRFEFNLIKNAFQTG
jgi:putative endonuclease